MEIVALEGMDLVSLEGNETSFDLKAMDTSGVLFQAFLSNPEQTPIGVVVHWANLRLIHDNERDIFTLGEIETITVDADVVHIEADAGYFSVRASKLFLQRLASLTGSDI